MQGVSITDFSGADQWEPSEVPMPQISAGEVLVRVRNAGISFVDVLVIEGKYQIKPPIPFCPGKEAAGVVEQVGSAVTEFAAGDRVMVLVDYGAFAEFVAAKQEQCFLLPEAMGFDVGATFGLPYQTAFFALRDRARVTAGDTIFVTGAGSGVGLAVVELAKAFGHKVLAGIATLSKAHIADASGADHIIELAPDKDKDRVRAEVREHTQGRGADVIIDVIGGDVFDTVIRCLGWRGRLVIVGFAAGRIPLIKANYLLLKNIEVSGLDWSDYRTKTPKLVSDAQKELFGLFLGKKIGSHVQTTIPFTRFSEAVRLIKERRVNGRITLAWS